MVKRRWGSSVHSPPQRRGLWPSGLLPRWSARHWRDVKLSRMSTWCEQLCEPFDTLVAVSLDVWPARGPLSTGFFRCSVHILLHSLDAMSADGLICCPFCSQWAFSAGSRSQVCKRLMECVASLLVAYLSCAFFCLEAFWISFVCIFTDALITYL